MVPGTGEPGEPLYDSHCARHMAWCVGLRIAGVLALFAILPVFLGTVLKKSRPTRELFVSSCRNFVDRDVVDDLVVLSGSEHRRDRRQGTRVASKVRIRVCKRLMAIRLGPFAQLWQVFVDLRYF
jgi:hypothetical protein